MYIKICAPIILHHKNIDCVIVFMGVALERLGTLSVREAFKKQRAENMHLYILAYSVSAFVF